MGKKKRKKRIDIDAYRRRIGDHDENQKKEMVLQNIENQWELMMINKG